MALYMVPAAIALLLKVGLLLSFSRVAWAGKKWAGFVAIFAVHNLAELLVYQRYVSGLAAEGIVRGYHVCSIFVVIYGVYYVIEERHVLQRDILMAAVSIGAALTVLILFSGLLLDGYTSLSYSITAQRGPLYVLFLTYVLFFVSAVGSLLAYNYKNCDSPMRQVDHAYTALALLPLLVSTSVIVILMITGGHINATLVTPIASTLFLLITLKGKDVYRISRDPRNMMPKSLESYHNKAVQQIQAQYGLETISHAQAMTLLERALIEYKLNKNNGNVSATAQSMRVPESTLDSKLNKFVIPNNGR